MTNNDNDYAAAFEDQTAAEEAFDRSEAYFFQGEQLEPFSGRRRRIAERLGLRFFDVLSNPEGFEEFSETKSYKGFEDDMVLVLWLCSVSKERCARARKYPDRAMDEADDWADEKGIFPGGPGHAEACQTFTEIVVDVLSAVMQASAPEGDGDDGPGKPRQTGASTSSHSQTRQESASMLPGGVYHSQEDTSTLQDTLNATV